MKKIITLLLLLFFYNFGTAQHLKKDGTPDMRYKENKQTYSNSSSYSTSSTTSYSSPTSTSSTSSSGVHLKKDGTPDMRYKENKETSTSSTTVTSAPVFSSNTNNNYTIKRDSKGRIKRSQAAKNDFKKQSGYPNGRSGYVIDHIKPLKEGGCDCPENMQWQTISEAKAKDKWE